MLKSIKILCQEVVSAGDWKVNPGNITTMHVTSQHAGVYVCTAWNDLGLNRSVQVVVTGETNIGPIRQVD